MTGAGDDPLIVGLDPGPVGRGRELPAGFRALRHRRFQLYFVGMLLRGTGVWMQLIGLPFYVVQLGATPLEVGIVAAMQTLPFLFIAPLGGVIADRLDRDKVLIAAQVGVLLQASAMALLISSGSGTIAAAAILGGIAGSLIALELPVRQAYLTDLVPHEDLTSAVSLHSTAFNTTRFIGPGIAGILIVSVGVSAVYVGAALLTLGVIATLRLTGKVIARGRAAAGASQSVVAAFMEGARYAFRDRRIRTALLFLAAGSIFGIQTFQTLAPLFVVGTLGLDGGAYGAFMAVWGAGAVVTAYIVTLVAHGDRRWWLIGGGAGLAILLALLSVTSWPVAAFILAGLLGASQISLVQNVLVSVQTAAPDELRGRVMSFYTTLFQGTAPFGALFAGVLASLWGVRVAMFAGAAALGVVVIFGFFALRRLAPDPRAVG